MFKTPHTLNYRLEILDSIPAEQNQSRWRVSLSPRVSLSSGCRCVAVCFIQSSLTHLAVLVHSQHVVFEHAQLRVPGGVCKRAPVNARDPAVAAHREHTCRGRQRDRELNSWKRRTRCALASFLYIYTGRERARDDDDWSLGARFNRQEGRGGADEWDQRKLNI